MTWHVYCDGSCQHGVANVPKRTPGWGGWCAIVEHGSDGVVLRGRVPETTNVRMELVAALEGLRVVPVGAVAVVHTDCTTVGQVALEHREGAPARTGADSRLWRALAAEIDRRRVLVELIVKGDRDPVHRRCHVIAGAEARGGLRDLPPNAAPLDELGGHHRVREGMRRHVARRARPGLVHRRGCEPGFCVHGCPVAVAFGAVGDLALRSRSVRPLA